MEPTSKKLLDQVRDAIRLKHYSIRTEHRFIYPMPCPQVPQRRQRVGMNDNDLHPRPATGWPGGAQPPGLD